MTDQERPSNQQSGINPEHMPPLEPTAEVPPVHSDKLNDPQYWNDKYQGKTANVPVEHRDDRTRESTPWYNKTVVKIGGAAAGLIAAVGVGIGVTSGGGDSHEPQSRPTATAPATPGNSESQEPSPTSSPETQEGAVTLDVERYQDGDQLIRAYVSEDNNWMIAGGTLDEDIDWGDGTGSDESKQRLEDSLDAISSKYDDEYVDALFVSDWQNRPQLADAIAEEERVHRNTMETRLMTTDSGKPEDQEPYEQEQDVTMTRVDESSADHMVVSYRYVYHSNADKNRGDLFIKNLDGAEGGETVTFLNEDGVWKISDIKHFAG